VRTRRAGSNRTPPARVATAKVAARIAAENTRAMAHLPAKYAHIGIGVARSRRSQPLPRSWAMSTPKLKMAKLTIP
jgi:hypothetical protein